MKQNCRRTFKSWWLKRTNLTNKVQECVVRFEDRNCATLIKRGLKRYGKVKVVDLGIFETRKIRARRGRNPSTGEIVKIRAYKKIKFRPTAPLKRAIC